MFQDQAVAVARTLVKSDVFTNEGMQPVLSLLGVDYMLAQLGVEIPGMVVDEVGPDSDSEEPSASGEQGDEKQANDGGERKEKVSSPAPNAGQSEKAANELLETLFKNVKQEPDQSKDKEKKSKKKKEAAEDLPARKATKSLPTEVKDVSEAKDTHVDSSSKEVDDDTSVTADIVSKFEVTNETNRLVLLCFSKRL